MCQNRGQNSKKLNIIDTFRLLVNNKYDLNKENKLKQGSFAFDKHYNFFETKKFVVVCLTIPSPSEKEGEGPFLRLGVNYWENLNKKSHYDQELLNLRHHNVDANQLTLLGTQDNPLSP